jgi:hypothetical protein
MRRMLLWTLLGGGGFVGFVVLFYAAAPHGPERWLFVVFALMAAVPVAVLGTILAALMALRDGLNEIRRELEHLPRRRFDKPVPLAEEASVQYQPKRFERGPG